MALLSANLQEGWGPLPFLLPQFVRVALGGGWQESLMLNRLTNRWISRMLALKLGLTTMNFDAFALGHWPAF